MSHPTSPTANTTGTSDNTSSNTPQGQNNVQPTSSLPQRHPNGGLYFPPLGNNNIVPDDTGDSLYAISARLMSPPQVYYSTDGKTVTLNKTWAVGVIGTGHFEPQEFFNHWVLYHGSEFRENGIDYGLSQEMLDWLCVPNHTVTLPAEHFIKVEEAVEKDSVNLHKESEGKTAPGC